jgi:hypothetical protein
MRPVRPQTIKVPPSGRRQGIETVKLCGEPAAWRITRGETTVFVCDDCKPHALEALPEDVEIELLDDPA